MRCHAYNDQGGSAGPRLNGIGSRLTREQILQALVQPSARIAPGYGTVTLTMKDNTQISATLLEEKANGYRIQKGEKGDTLLLKENILQKSIGPSSMPQMQYLLTLKEIRDLVSFLSTQKEEK
jgi:putative heme-binding domain-containing protein